MKHKFLNKLWLRVGIVVAIITTALAGTVKAQSYDLLFTIESDDVVTNSSYTAYNTTVSERDFVITFGGNNKSVGTNSGGRSNCKLSSYSKYAVSPVTTSSVASAFACKTSISDVSKISYTFNGGSNQTNTKVYLLYSSDNTTFSQVSLTSGTQGATISSGTAYVFSPLTGYFALLFEATNSSGNWRIDDVNVSFYKQSVVPITSIAFSEPKTASVGVGGTVTLTPTVLPVGHTETVDWVSDATDVATVSSAGVVTGVAAGTAHITAKAHDNPSTIYDVCTVTVTAAVGVTGVSLNKTSTTLSLGGTETLEATIAPNDATNTNLEWTSSDDTKVSVENGVITALALTNGTPVNITVTTADGGFTASCAVTVNPVPVSSVSLDRASARLVIGNTLTLEATVSPDNATDKTVTWESDDEDVATVENGEVTAIAEGTATITVKSNADNTKTATCTITVTDGSIDLRTSGTISFGPFTGAELGTGGYKDKDCELTGSDENTYTWHEKDGYYNNSGWQIKASSGLVTSPVIKSNNGFTISVTKKTNDVVISDGTNSGKNSLTTTKTNTTITIKGDGAYAVFTGIAITPTKDPIATEVSITDPGTLAKGATGTFTGASTDADDCTKSWSSNNSSIIEIKDDSTGAYEAKGRGTAKITYTITPDDATTYSTVSAERNVSVTEPVVITASDVDMTYGDTPTAIGATTSAGYAGTLSYTSGNTNIATVNASGNVTAVAVGTTTITISAPADAGNLYTAGADKVINVTVSAPAGGEVAATNTQTADDYEELTSAATGWTYTNWTTSTSYGACSTAGTAGTLKTKDYTIPEKANPCVFFEHTGKTFANPSVACKLYVQEGDNTPVELTIPTYFAGDKYDNPYIESGDIDITAYRGKTVHFIFEYTPSTGNEGKWEVMNFGIYYDIFSVKLNGSGYATYCSEYPIDFSGASDYSAWQITDINSSNEITFKQVTGSVKGGTGLLLKGTPNAIISLTSANSTNTLGDNLLEGTLAPTYVADGTYYGLSGNSFKSINAGNVKAGKAILDAGWVTSSVKVFTFIFEDDATGIRTVETVSAEEAAQIFNLAGQKLSKMQKGINIVNGKKVLK